MCNLSLFTYCPEASLMTETSWLVISAVSAYSGHVLSLSQSPLWGWGNLIMAFTGKFVYMAHHFILLPLNPFKIRVDRERWWYLHPVSQSRVFLAVDSAKNVAWPWLSPLRGWCSLAMAFTGKLVNLCIFIYTMYLMYFSTGCSVTFPWRFSLMLSVKRFSYCDFSIS